MSVFKRGDKAANRWHYEFAIRGVRYRGSIPEARNKAQARAAELSIRNSVYEGRYTRRRDFPRLADFVNKTFLPWSRANKRSWRSDEVRCDTLVAAFGARRLDEITPFLVEKFKRERREFVTRRGRAITPASVNMELGLLSRVFTLAQEQGVNVANPCSKVRRLRVQNARNRVITAGEESRLLAACEGRREYLRPVILLALATGMRRGEITSLLWSQVDFSRRLVNVRGTKTGHDRIVPLNATALSVLTQLHARPGRGERVFDDRKWSGAFDRARAAAGLADVCFHDLRHTCATRMVEGGADAFTVAAVLGHASVKMTARYAHATGDSMRSAVACLERKQESRPHDSPTAVEGRVRRLAVNE